MFLSFFLEIPANNEVKFFELKLKIGKVQCAAKLKNNRKIHKTATQTWIKQDTNSSGFFSE